MDRNYDDRTSNSNENIEGEVPHYQQTGNMLHGELKCTRASAEELRRMSPERRWAEDCRVPIWNHGMVNCGFDVNFIYGANVINDTDHRLLKISGEVVDDEGRPGRAVVATRDIRYNGRWWKLK